MHFRNTAFALLSITSTILGSTLRGRYVLGYQPSDSMAQTPHPPSRNCGTTITPEQVEAAEAHFSANKIITPTASNRKAPPIDVYFHVIRSGTKLADGNIP